MSKPHLIVFDELLNTLTGNVEYVRRLHEYLTERRVEIAYFIEDSLSPASIDIAYRAGSNDGSDSVISARIVIRHKKAAHVLYHELLHASLWLRVGFEFQRERTLFSERYNKVVGNAIDHLWMGPAEVETYPEAAEYWLQRLRDSVKEARRFSPNMKNLTHDGATTAMAKWIDFYPYRGNPQFQDDFTELDAWYRRYHLLEFLEPLAKLLEQSAPVYRTAYFHFEEAVNAYLAQKPISKRRHGARRPSMLITTLVGEGNIL